MRGSTSFQQNCNHYCTHCVLAPFCTAKEKSSDTALYTNSIVRRHRVLDRREILFSPKNKFKNLYVIQQGALKTFQTEADGKELIRGFYFAGETLGYEAIYTGQYHFSAAALVDTLICEIPYEQFLESLYKRPTLQKQVLHLISQQLNAGSYLVSTTAEQRIAAFLIDLSIRLPSLEEKLEFVFPISRQDIGNYLGLTGETISRIFSQFKNKNLIALNNKHIRLLQPDTLKKIADGLISINDNKQHYHETTVINF